MFFSNKKNLLGVVITLGFFCSTGFAIGGRGGGDPCKNEIDKDRLAILGWIERDEAKDLDFRLARVPGWSYENYKERMLSVLKEGEVVVTCFLDPARISDPAAKKIAEEEGVSYKAITIGNPPEPTTCINYEDESEVSHIDCNYDLVMASSSIGNPDYVTTHHEFASIAGVEARTNSYVSDLSISNQVSQYKHLESRWVLGPKSTSACPGCTSADVDILLMPVKEALKVANFEFHLKKDIFFETDGLINGSAKTGHALFSGHSMTCEWQSGTKAANKTVSCENPDGSKRGILLQSKNVKYNFDRADHSKVYPPAYPIQERVTIATGIAVAPTIVCKSRRTWGSYWDNTPLINMGELVDSLSEYLELVEIPKPSKI